MKFSKFLDQIKLIINSDDVRMMALDQFGVEYNLEDYLNNTLIKEESLGTKFRIYNDMEIVSEFMLTPFPGQANLIISHNAIVTEKYRNKGLGTLLCLLRLYICQFSSCDCMGCIVNEYNSHQIKIMNKLGFDSHPIAYARIYTRDTGII